MQLNPGTLLISKPLLDDENFEQAVVLITEHNKKGATGFVINNLFPRTLNELIEFKNSPSFKLYDGGPVERESIFFIHQRPDLITGGTLIFNNIYLGGDFKQAVNHINNKTILDNHIKLFIGYCGWDDKQLEEEIEEGSWLVVDDGIKHIFSTDTSTLWKNLYCN